MRGTLEALFAKVAGDSCIAEQFISAMPDRSAAKGGNPYAAKDIAGVVHADVEPGKSHECGKPQSKIAVPATADPPEDESCGKSADRVAGRKGKGVGQLAQGQKFGMCQEGAGTHDQMLQDCGYATAEQQGAQDEHSVLARGFTQG